MNYHEIQWESHEHPMGSMGSLLITCNGTIWKSNGNPWGFLIRPNEIQPHPIEPSNTNGRNWSLDELQSHEEQMEACCCADHLPSMPWLMGIIWSEISLFTDLIKIAQLVADSHNSLSSHFIVVTPDFCQEADDVTSWSYQFQSSAIFSVGSFSGEEDRSGPLPSLR